MSTITLPPAIHNLSIAILVCGIVSCGGDGGTGLAAPAVATVTVTPPSSTIAPGGTLQLQAVIQDADGTTLADREITWSSSDNAVATVSSAGLVTGVAGGSATITGASEGKSGTAEVVVQIPVASVIVDPSAATLTLSATVSLAVMVLDATGNELVDREVSWSSSNPGVASVSETGLVTALADGTATISATVEGQSGTALITVVGATADVAGLWSLHETLSDDNLGYACENFQTVTLVQNGTTFTGTNEQVGSCTIGGETFDNSGTFEITDGQITGSAISFTQPGAPPCVYDGTVSDPLMDGTVSCVGSVEGTQVNARGTWCAERVGGVRLQPARADKSDSKLGRIPTCT
ncbi:MAG TPA: Ig-like domain-containing protein [Gemmatimonadales bacterium]|nr:Ig-like domain-containing protein [Gemmatimonadales bacterium]